MAPYFLLIARYRHGEEKHLSVFWTRELAHTCSICEVYAFYKWIETHLYDICIIWCKSKVATTDHLLIFHRLIFFIQYTNSIISGIIICCFLYLSFLMLVLSALYLCINNLALFISFAWYILQWGKYVYPCNSTLFDFGYGNLDFGVMGSHTSNPKQNVVCDKQLIMLVVVGKEEKWVK